MDANGVSNAVARFFRAVDERDWEGLRSAMSAPFHLDYASFGGGDPADLEPERIVEGWAGFLPGFEHTHHQLGNLEITVGDGGARVRCYGTATHAIGPEVWTVVGSYDVELVHREGWRVCGLRFDYRYQSGALDLPDRARERMSG